MARRKVKPLGSGYECLLPPFVPTIGVNAVDVVKACDVLMNAGFNHEATTVLARVLTVPKELGGSLGAAERRYAEWGARDG